MGPKCRGICARLPVVERTNTRAHTTDYMQGKKYCAVCEVRFRQAPVDNRCGCCKGKLRSHPHKLKARQKEVALFARGVKRIG